MPPLMDEYRRAQYYTRVVIWLIALSLAGLVVAAVIGFMESHP